MAEPRTPEERRFAGLLLMVVGSVMAALCGGCTLTYWAAFFADPIRPEDATLAGALFGLSLVVGVLPTVAGAYLVRRGWRELRTGGPRGER